MAIIFGAIFAVSQCLSIVVLYWCIAIALAVIMPRFIPGYDALNGLNDTQALLLVLLLWDRFYGPYSKLLRGVAKTLKAAQKRRAE